MTINNIWVVVEPSNGALTTTSLELLTHARSLSSNVAAITWGGDGAALAAQAGDVGAGAVEFGIMVDGGHGLNPRT